MRLRLALFIAMAVGLLWGSSRPDTSAEVVDVSVELQGGRVLATFALEGAIGADLLQRVQSGLPTEIVYEIQLLRDRKRWWDDLVTTSELRVVAMYNAITLEYLVNYKLDGKLIESRLVQRLPDLELAMTRVDSMPLFTLADRPSGERMLIRTRAILGSRIVLSFVPVRVETGWTESRKFRVP